MVSVNGFKLHRDPKIVGLLLDLANKHPDDVTYHNVVRNLGALGDQSTLKALEHILQKNNHYDIRVQVTTEETIERLRQEINKSS